jgi:hypothetical protein
MADVLILQINNEILQSVLRASSYRTTLLALHHAVISIPLYLYIVNYWRAPDDEETTRR